MKIKIILMAILVCSILGSLIVNASDVFRFSGVISANVPDHNLNGTVAACGNGVCSSWENHNNCPEDCDEEITPYFNVTLVNADTGGMANNSYEYGWAFTFLIDFYANASRVEFAIDDWTDGLGHSIITDGNTKMEYPKASGGVGTYYVKNDFQEPASNFVDSLADTDLSKPGVQAHVTIYVKLPYTTYPGTYFTTYHAGLYV